MSITRGDPKIKPQMDSQPDASYPGISERPFTSGSLLRTRPVEPPSHAEPPCVSPRTTPRPALMPISSRRGSWEYDARPRIPPRHPSTAWAHPAGVPAPLFPGPQAAGRPGASLLSTDVYDTTDCIKAE